MYTLQLDKSNIFECNLKIQGADMKKSKINLIVESGDYSLRFKGSVGEYGKVSIPLPKLKNILEENVKGKMFLEVVVDDTYFVPYETDYVTEVSMKVEVVIPSSRNQIVENVEENKISKPIVTISEVKNEEKTNTINEVNAEKQDKVEEIEKQVVDKKQKNKKETDVKKKNVLSEINHIKNIINLLKEDVKKENKISNIKNYLVRNEISENTYNKILVILNK